MTDPNSHQVGGDHYRSAYEPWDFTLDVFGGCFFLGNANKYITRWRKKNGLEDLQKAKHYLEKAKANYVAGRCRPPEPLTPGARDALLSHYAMSNDLGMDEEDTLRALMGGNIITALSMVERLITSVSRP